MPPTAVIPGWVSIASPLRYLTPMVETNSSGKIKAEVMVISINLLKTILLWLSQNNQLWKKAIEKIPRVNRTPSMTFSLTREKAS